MRVAVLHQIRSLHNVGSIFRTADGAGFQKIYLCGITPIPCDVWGKTRQEIAKVSLGAEKAVAWEKAKSAKAVIRKLKKEGFLIVALEQRKNSEPYGLFHPRRGKIALVLGNEISGIPPSILREADHIVEIPMRGKKESLNVSVAFGIIAFHLEKGRLQKTRRQRLKTTTR